MFDRKAYNKEWSRLYYLNNKDKVDTRNKRWKIENTEYNRKKLLWTRYRLTPEEYDKLVENHKGCCSICNKEVGKKLHIDHCHTTKKVRGLLCENCNRGLGMFKDNSELLIKASKYLNDHNSG